VSALTDEMDSLCPTRAVCSGAINGDLAVVA